MKRTNGLIWGLWSADPSWVCNSNGCGLQDSGSGWKQGNVFLFMLSGHCTCHREGVNPRATNLHQPAQSLFPSFQLSPQKIWLFLRSLPTFFWHKGSKANTYYLSESSEAKRTEEPVERVINWGKKASVKWTWDCLSVKGKHTFFCTI